MTAFSCRLHGYGTAIGFLSWLTMIYIWYHAKDLQLLHEEEEEEGAPPEREMEPLNSSQDPELDEADTLTTDSIFEGKSRNGQSVNV